MSQYWRSEDLKGPQWRVAAALGQTAAVVATVVVAVAVVVVAAWEMLCCGASLERRLCYFPERTACGAVEGCFVRRVAVCLIERKRRRTNGNESDGAWLGGVPHPACCSRALRTWDVVRRREIVDDCESAASGKPAAGTWAGG